MCVENERAAFGECEPATLYQTGCLLVVRKHINEPGGSCARPVRGNMLIRLR